MLLTCLLSYCVLYKFKRPLEDDEYDDSDSDSENIEIELSNLFKKIGVK